MTGPLFEGMKQGRGAPESVSDSKLLPAARFANRLWLALEVFLLK